MLPTPQLLIYAKCLLQNFTHSSRKFNLLLKMFLKIYGFRYILTVLAPLPHINIKEKVSLKTESVKKKQKQTQGTS